MVVTAVICFWLSVPMGILALMVWGLTFMFSGRVSLASLIATLTTSLTATQFLSTSEWVTLLMLSALMLLMHRSNIVRLWQGTEQKISKRAS